jgi:DNA-binding response OmpR family regulator
MKRILIIEDNPIITSIYRAKLTAERFLADVAPNGETGLALFAKQPPDLVLLDLMLPGISGIEVLRTLRARPESANVPVVVFSSNYTTAMAEQAWAAGATDVLRKASVTPTQLVDLVKRALQESTPLARPPTPAASAPPSDPPALRLPRVCAALAEFLRDGNDARLSALLVQVRAGTAGRTSLDTPTWLVGALEALLTMVQGRRLAGLGCQDLDSAIRAVGVVISAL